MDVELEYELTINITFSDAMAIASTCAATPVAFVDKQLFVDRNRKHVHRVYETGEIQNYEKHTTSKKNMLYGTVMYKESIETKMSTELSHKTTVIKKRISCPTIEKFNKVKFELTYGYNAANKNKTFEDLMQYFHFGALPDDTNMNNYFAYFSFEANGPLSHQVIIEMLQFVEQTYELSYHLVYTHMLKSPKKTPFAYSLNSLASYKVLELNMENARRYVFPAKNEKEALWHSLKLEGVLSYLFLWNEGLMILLTKQHFLFEFQGERYEKFSDLWGNKWKAIEKILETPYLVCMEGELVKQKFYAFAKFEEQTVPATSWLEATNDLDAIDNYQSLVRNITLVPKKYVPFSDTCEYINEQIDGEIFVVIQSNTKYIKAKHYKAKPGKLSTLDCIWIGGIPYIKWKSAPKLIRYKWPFLDMTYMDSAVLLDPDCPVEFHDIPDCKVVECAITSPNTLMPLRIRNDKVMPNGSDTHAAVVNTIIVNDWLSFIKTKDDVGFSGRMSAHPFRYSISKTTREVVQSLLEQDESLKILDIGGGKLGYASALDTNNIELYTNVDLDKYELCGGLSRIAGNAKLKNLYEVYEMIESSMTYNTTLKILQHHKKTEYNRLFSIFAIHFACESADTMNVFCELVQKVCVAGCKLLFIVWDGDIIAADLNKGDEPVSYGIVTFAQTDNPRIVHCTPTFGNTGFLEPLFRFAEFDALMKQAGTQLLKKETMAEHMQHASSAPELLEVAQKILVLSYMKM